MKCCRQGFCAASCKSRRHSCGNSALYKVRCRWGSAPLGLVSQHAKTHITLHFSFCEILLGVGLFLHPQNCLKLTPSLTSVLSSSVFFHIFLRAICCLSPIFKNIIKHGRTFLLVLCISEGFTLVFSCCQKSHTFCLFLCSLAQGLRAPCAALLLVHIFVISLQCSLEAIDSLEDCEFSFLFSFFWKISNVCA